MPTGHLPSLWRAAESIPVRCRCHVSHYPAQKSSVGMETLFAAKDFLPPLAWVLISSISRVNNPTLELDWKGSQYWLEHEM